MSENLFDDSNLTEFVYLKYDDENQLIVGITDELENMETKVSNGKYGEQHYLVTKNGLLKIDSVRLRRALKDCIEGIRSTVKSGKLIFPLAFLITRKGTGFKTMYRVEQSK